MTILDRTVRHMAVGQGEPLVLVHGLAGSWRWWSRNIDALAAHYRVYVLDLGRRDRWATGSKRVRPVEGGAVLDRWLDACGIEDAHVIGHSLGGAMAIRLAAAHPDRVKTLVLVDAAGTLHGNSLIRLTARACSRPPELNREFRRMLLEDTLRTNPLVVFQTARDLVRDDLGSVVGQVQAPTLIVWGGRDHVLPVAHAYRLREQIPHAELFVIPHSGHNPMHYHAGTFNRRVLRFLGAHARVHAVS